MASTTTTTTTAAPTTAETTLSSPPAVFSMGPNTLTVDLMALHGGNRTRLLAALRGDPRVGASDIVLLQGGDSGSVMHFSTDHEDVFRQESFFHWAFGVREPDVYGSLDIATGAATLYVPRLPASYAVWMGPIPTLDDYKAAYGVDKVCYADDLPTAVSGIPQGAAVHVLTGTNTDSGSAVPPAAFDGLDSESTNGDVLHEAMIRLRSIKTEPELEVMRYVCKVSSEAHVALMRALKPGMYEYQAEALFQHHCYFYGGHRHVGYTCICGAGTNSAILHYGHAGAPNNHAIKDGDMVLFDMGGEYMRYGADITCSYPANGVFSDRQKTIYQIVWDTVKAVEAAMAPGVEWTDMHLLAERTILNGLVDAGILSGSVDEMMDVALAPTFMPHGLGHLLGIDTHDVGGYLDGASRSDRPGLASLRLGRALEENMVVTVEPGVYFVACALDAALADPAKAKFINVNVLDSFRDFGGVRIEDDVVVTADGIENLTNVPREVADIEAVMAGGDWS